MYYYYCYYYYHHNYKNPTVAEMGHNARATWAKKYGVGAAVHLFVGGAGPLSNTLSPGPSPTSVPSSILIHTTVWPQYTNVSYVTDRQDRTGSTTVL